MGSSASSEAEEEDQGPELSAEELDVLKSRTHFSSAELHEWHERFMNDYPSGKIMKHEFIDMYSKLLPDGNSYSFASHVFRAYDRDGNGSIDFKEWMHTISITTRGDPHEKLLWAFRMYDLNRDGELSQKEIVEILLSIYKMRGIQEDDLKIKAENTTVKIFCAMDKDGDCHLSREEFVQGVEKCGAVKELLGGSSDD